MPISGIRILAGYKVRISLEVSCRLAALKAISGPFPFGGLRGAKDAAASPIDIFCVALFLGGARALLGRGITCRLRAWTIYKVAMISIS